MMYGYRNEAYEGILKRIEFTSLDKSKYSGIWNVLRTMSLKHIGNQNFAEQSYATMAEHCLLYTSPSPRDQRGSRMPSSA